MTEEELLKEREHLLRIVEAARRVDVYRPTWCKLYKPIDQYTTPARCQCAKCEFEEAMKYVTDNEIPEENYN